MDYKDIVSADYGKAVRSFGGISVYEEIAIPKPVWLVEDMIIEGGHHVIYGMTGHKKSFLAIDLAQRLVNGMDYHGRKTTPCEVLYVVGEDEPEFVKRRGGWMLFHPTATKLVKHIPYPVQIGGDSWDDLIDAVRYFNVGLVIFDNLADCAVNVELVDNDDYNAKVKPFRKKLTEETGAATLFLHHTGKNPNAGALGAQTIINDANLSMKIGFKDGLTTLNFEKLRGASANQPPLLFSYEQSGESIVLVTATKPNTAEAEKASPKSGTRNAKRKVTDIERVRLAVAEHGPIRPRDIANRTGLAYSKVTAYLSKLVKRGALVNNNGLYELPNEGG
jgi:predicted transcriptional regulator